MEIVKDSLLKLTGQNNGFTDEVGDLTLGKVVKKKKKKKAPTKATR